jgi:hypothetical protein
MRNISKRDSRERPANNMELNTVVGMDEDEAFALLKRENITYRIRSRNGEPYMGTCDYRLDRLNLTIIDGIVTSVTFG